MWPIVESVVASGESYAYPENFTGDEDRTILMAGEHMVVLTEGDAILGTAKIGPNRGRPR